MAFVFADKAVKEIMESSIEDELKTELLNAKKYAEGRGIQIPVTDSTLLPDIKLLVEIKLKY